jgi:cytoskeletal protein CcmA (bactofilin family)
MAWKREDQPAGNPEPSMNPTRSAVASPSVTSPSEPRRTGERATIGPSIIIKGDLSGEEDLVIEGRVEGKVDLKQHNVTVGRSGRVKADIFGKVVTIEGEVDGNVFAQEQAILRQAGAIRGNITAPRVVLEDGSRFKGSIDMESSRERGLPQSAPSRPQPVETGKQAEPAGPAAQAG